MRHLQQKINKARERGRKMGIVSQKAQANKRLQKALECGPIRPIESFLVHEFISINPRTGQMRYLELRHDVGNGNSKFNLYIDGEKYGKEWSKTSFGEWIVNQIDSVRSNWD